MAAARSATIGGNRHGRSLVLHHTSSKRSLNHISGAKAGVAGIYNLEAYENEKRAALDRWAGHIDSVVSGRADDTVVPIRGRAS